MKESQDIVTVGRFGAVHGVKGFIRVHSFTHPRDNILNYQPWLVKCERTNEYESMTVRHVEQHSKGLIVKFERFANREQAQSLTNREIAIRQEQLPALDAGEYYWRDLIGLKVINLENIELGTVSRLIDTGSNDVLLTEGGKKQYCIPYILDEYVTNINLDTQEITVDWDEDF